MAKKIENFRDQRILVVMKKEMLYSEYMKIIQNATSKGWRIQAYEVGFYNDGLKQEIK